MKDDSSVLWRLDQARIDPPEPAEECECESYQCCDVCMTREEYDLDRSGL